MPDYTFPVVFDGARISSGIGPRSAPVSGASTWHKGIDIAADRGSPVVAPVPMEVIFAGQATGYGNAVYARDAGGNVHRFGHLDSIGVGMGADLSQGMQLGTVGSTGNSSGNHLHYEVRDAGGKLLSGLTNRVVQTGQRLAQSQLGNVINAVLKSNPITAPFAFGADAIGLGADDILGGGGCGINPICHFKQWLEESDFVERAALYILATIFIIGGIAFLALGYSPKQLIAKAAK